MMRTGGRMVVDGLLAHGVRRLACIPGESYLEILDALYDVRDRVRLVTARHESGAAFMAEAEGKLTGRAGVCLVTRGPGACNAAIAVHTAFQDSTPMVMLVGQVPTAHKGREAFQEVDIPAMFAPLAKWTGEAGRVEQIPEMMARAFAAAVSGRPGPAVLALPEDLLSAAAEVADADPIAPAPILPPDGAMADLGARLSRAERPMMLVGGGGWDDDARERVAAFAMAGRIPVCCSFRRHDIVDNALMCFAGELGIGPNPKLAERVAASDLLLVAGARLGEMTSQGYTLLDPAWTAKNLVHVHVDAAELGRVFPPALAVNASMGAFAQALTRLDVALPEARIAWMAEARADYDAYRRAGGYAGPLDLSRVMAELGRRLRPGDVVTTDAGNFSGWAQRFLLLGGGVRFLGPTCGAMGYGVPAAVAASAARPEARVVACVGDGGFMMTGHEIATAVQYGLAPVILVFNNGMFGTIRMHQERSHPGRVMGTELANPDFVALAHACHAFGERVTTTEQFAPAFDRALASRRAAVLELVTDPAQITTKSRLGEIR